jgi:hypothetical protein
MNGSGRSLNEGAPMKILTVVLTLSLTAAGHGRSIPVPVARPTKLSPNSVTMRIAADPPTQLPGIGAILRIWMTNPGSEPAEIPTRVALQVIPPRGDPFVAYTTARGEERTMDLIAGPTVLQPGETRELTCWSCDDWFGAEARLTATGVFRLQLIADQGLDRFQVGYPVLDQAGLVQPIVSNETTYTVLTPTGADLEVWNAAKGKFYFCVPEIAELIWGKYPTSGYAAYCPRNTSDEPLKRIAGYEAALAKSPHPYWAESYRINMADAWNNRAWMLLQGKDAKGAADAYDRARVLLEPLTHHAISEIHRREAEQMLQDHVRSGEQIAELLKPLDEREMVFGCSCYEQLPDGKRKVWFSYNNPRSKPIEFPIGNANKFTPPPFDRGQPTTFNPGITMFAFNVVTDEPVLVWHLQKKTAEFKLPGAVECPKGFDPNDPETWTTQNE